MVTLPRYRYGARFYDTVSGERLLYRHGRAAAIRLLALQPGARVLVVGCGTGLDLPLLTAAVGARGEVVGIDASAAMLAQARRKVVRAGWRNVRLVDGDAATLPGVHGTFDAVLFTYSLSVIHEWRRAWQAALGRLAPSGRVAVVDTDLPTGLATPLRPLARLALWAGKVDRNRKVWTTVLDGLTDTRYHRLARGHIHVAVGTSTGPAARQEAG